MLDPWKWSVVVLCGATADVACHRAKELGIDNATADANAAGHAWLNHGVVGVVWVESLQDWPCFVHEAMHIVAGILEARGLKFTEASEEAYTYTVEHLCRAVLKAKWQ